MQFSGNIYIGSQTLAPTQVAGFGSYASANYNAINAGANTVDGPGGFYEGLNPNVTNGALVRDVNGTSTASSATLSYSGFDRLGITGAIEGTNNGKLYKFPLTNFSTDPNGGSGTGSISVNGVGYANYSAIVYLSKSAFDGENANAPVLTVNGTAVAGLTVNGWGPDGTPTTFRNAQTSAAGNANYVIVTGLTAANFTLTLGTPATGGDAGIAGFTLLNAPVPEPTTLAGLAGVGLLALRRRSC